MTEYIYQYDFDGFPIPKVLDLARRMKYHKKKYYKKCEKDNCNNEILNKPYRHFCLDHMLDHYASNKSIKDFFELEKKIES